MNKVQSTSGHNSNESLVRRVAIKQQISFWKHLIIFFYSIIFISVKVAFSQTAEIDSLKRALTDPHNDELTILLELCKNNPSMNADTALVFAKRALQISTTRHDFAGRITAEFYIAECDNMKGRADSCLVLCNNALKELPHTDKFYPAYRDLMWNKIVSLTKLRTIKESINECYNLLSSAERDNDIPGRVIAHNCLGLNNNILENRAEAISQVRMAYSLIEEDTAGISSFPQYGHLCGVVLINLSAMYFYHNMNDSGFFFLQKAYNLARENQDLKIESDCYNLRGQVYAETGKADSAEALLKRAVNIEEHIGNIQYILVGLDAMESFYAREKNYAKAIDCIREEQWYSKKYVEPLVFQAYRDLATYYKELKNYKAYGEASDTLMMLKDSMYQKSKAEDLAKLEAQYDVSSKEAFIAKQKLQLLHKNLWIAGVVAISLLLLAAAFLSYYYQKRKQKIALYHAEEKERKRIAADLHDNIGAYASAISDSIDDIENRKLITDSSSLQNLKSNAAEIISSLRDTIWAFNKESVNLTGISDRLKIYIQKIRPSYPKVNLMMEENIDSEIKLSPAKALHTFRIVQEAIHNSLSHSSGNKIIIKVSGSDDNINITIEDNGSGFDFEAMKNAGNGLANMETRAAEAGYLLTFSKADTNGTLVRITSKK